VVLHEAKEHKYLKGAAILAAASVFVKIIGAIYKIPLFNVLDAAGRGAFQVTYNVFALILAISTAGVPAALSRLVSSARAVGNIKLVRRYISVALPAFSVIGIVAMLVMFFLADELAGLLRNSLAAPGIRVLAPAALFACIISVYRGYAQGLENMIPTAMSQMIEVVSKLVFGIAVALWLTDLDHETHIVSAGAITGVTIGLALCVPLIILYSRKLNHKLPPCKSTGEIPDSKSVLEKIMKVSLPISLSASFMAIMVLIDNSIILGRLQATLGYTEYEASALMGVYALGLAVYNLPPAIVVPVSISIIPAIAAALARKSSGEAGVIMQSSIKLVNLIAMPAGAGIIVLAAPILIALYNDAQQLAVTILMILGVASFFVCLQFISTAVLQANGYERVALMTFPIGAAAKVIIAYVLSGNPNFGIIASPIGTLTCFLIISTLNILIIKARVREKPKLSSVFIKPLFCSVIMAGIAYPVYLILYRIGSGILGTGRLAVIVYLGFTILIAIAAYGVLVILTRTITREDMKLVPRGEKIANILRVK
jgi:stage V sporulation protein B